MSKPVSIGSVIPKKAEAVTKMSDSKIRLKAVSDAERERLRIPSYQYLLP